MSAIDHVRVIIAREKIHAFWRTLDTDWCYAADLPARMRSGFMLVAIDPEDRVTWDVHQDLAAALLRKSA